MSDEVPARPGIRESPAKARAYLLDLIGERQLWQERCREFATSGGGRVEDLLTPDSDEEYVFQTCSMVRWKSADHPDTTPELSAATVLAKLAAHLTGNSDDSIDEVADEFLTHCAAAGLHSVGVEMPNGTLGLANHRTTLGAWNVHLLSRGVDDIAGRGYAMLAAINLSEVELATGRSTRVPVLIARYNDPTSRGEVAMLTLRELQGGPRGLYPDPSTMHFLSVDSDFTDGLRTAWQTNPLLAQDGACVVWSLTEDGKPVQEVSGNSITAALAVALDDIAPRTARTTLLRPRALDPKSVVTAGLRFDADSDDETALTPVEGKRGKLPAAQEKNLRVVVADKDLEAARKVAEEVAPGLTIDGAGTLTEAIAQTRTRLNPLWVLMVGFTVVSLIIGTATVAVALGYRNRVQSQAAQDIAANNAALLLDKARSMAVSDPAMARLLVLAAYRTADNPVTRSGLLSLGGDAPTRVDLDWFVDVVATNPRGAVAAAANHDGKVEIISVGADRITRGRPIDVGSRVIALAISPNDRWLGTVGDHLVLWDIHDIADPRPIYSTALELEGVSAAFRADSQQLAVGTAGETVLRWNVPTGSGTPELLEPLQAHAPNAVVAFSAAEATLAVLSPPSGTLTLWDSAAAAAPLAPWYRHSDSGFAPNTVVFHPQQSAMVLGSQTGSQIKLLRLPEEKVGPVEETTIVVANSIQHESISATSGFGRPVFTGDGMRVAAGTQAATYIWWPGIETGPEVISGKLGGIVGTGAVLLEGIKHLDFKRRPGAALRSASPLDTAPGLGSAITAGMVWQFSDSGHVGAPWPPTVPGDERRTFNATALSRDGRTALLSRRGGEAGVFQVADLAHMRPVGPSLLGMDPLIAALDPTGAQVALSRYPDPDASTWKVELLQLHESGPHTTLPSLESLPAQPVSLAFLDERVLMVGLRNGWVMTVDLRAPSGPAVMWSTFFGTGATEIAVDHTGKRALVSGDCSDCGAVTMRGVYLLDMSDASNPVVLARITDEGVFADNPNAGPRMSFRPDGQQVALSFINQGDMLVDISDPRSPQTYAWLSSYGVAAAYVSDTTIVAQYQTGLQVRDIDPRVVADKICRSGGKTTITAQEWTDYRLGQVPRPDSCPDSYSDGNPSAAALLPPVAAPSTSSRAPIPSARRCEPEGGLVVTVLSGPVDCATALRIAREDADDLRDQKAEGQGAWTSVEGWRCNTPYPPGLAHSEVNYRECSQDDDADASRIRIE